MRFAYVHEDLLFCCCIRPGLVMCHKTNTRHGTLEVRWFGLQECTDATRSDCRVRFFDICATVLGISSRFSGLATRHGFRQSTDLSPVPLQLEHFASYRPRDCKGRAWVPQDGAFHFFEQLEPSKVAANESGC